MSIPLSVQHLLFQGQQLDNVDPLLTYNIGKHATIFMVLRLWWGSGGKPSSSWTFSYKYVIHAQTLPKENQTQMAPWLLLVEKSEEVPSLEISHSNMEDLHKAYLEATLIFWFNGFWLWMNDLYQWIHMEWTKGRKVIFFLRGFFIVLFGEPKHYKKKS